MVVGTLVNMFLASLGVKDGLPRHKKLTMGWQGTTLNREKKLKITKTYLELASFFVYIKTNNTYKTKLFKVTTVTL